MQGNNDKYLKVSTSCKHYAGYNLEHWHNLDRYTFNAIISDFDLNETYLVPFKYCITEGKVSSLMCSFNEVNGVPSCANKYLLTDLARNKWLFNGYITSDCKGVQDVYYPHNYTTDPSETVATVYRAGMDMECGSFIIENALTAIESNKLAVSDMQASLYRAALVQFRLGLFDDPTLLPWYNISKNEVCNEAHLQLALEATQQSIVLLQNNAKVLPLTKLNT